MNIKLKNVRLSYAHLFTARAVNEGDKPKFSASFILDKEKHAKAIKQVQAAIKQLAMEAFKGKVPSTLKPCLRDGEEYEDKDGYGEDVMFIAASSDKRPPVVDRDMTPITAEDDKIYSGCYVNVTLRLWVQNNQYGKRVNAALRAVQFVRDGEALGAEPVNVDEEFEELDDEEDEDEAPKKKGKSKTSGTASKKKRSVIEDDDDEDEDDEEEEAPKKKSKSSAPAKKKRKVVEDDDEDEDDD